MSEIVSLQESLNLKWQEELRLALERVDTCLNNLGRIASIYSKQLNFDQAMRDYYVEV